MTLGIKMTYTHNGFITCSELEALLTEIDKAVTAKFVAQEKEIAALKRAINSDIKASKNTASGPYIGGIGSGILSRFGLWE